MSVYRVTKLTNEIICKPIYRGTESINQDKNMFIVALLLLLLVLHGISFRSSAVELYLNTQHNESQEYAILNS